LFVATNSSNFAIAVWFGLGIGLEKHLKTDDVVLDHGNAPRASGPGPGAMPIPLELSGRGSDGLRATWPAEKFYNIIKQHCAQWGELADSRRRDFALFASAELFFGLANSAIAAMATQTQDFFCRSCASDVIEDIWTL
jgi:hypothetical protein